LQLSGKDFKHILVIGSIGIGNLLMFRPVLTVLRQRLPHAKITLLVLKRGFAEVFTGDPLVDKVQVADFRDYPGLMKKIGLVRDLRRSKFDLTITSFPANRLEYNALAFLTGAPQRVAHLYSRKRLASLSFLQNVRVPVVLGIHDVEQNYNLLEPFGWREANVRLTVEMPLSDQETAFGADFLRQLRCDMTRPVVGVHPGSSEEHQMIYKRWPIAHFAALIDRLQAERCAQVLVFAGPGEEALVQAIVDTCKQKPVIVQGLRLRQAAGIISQCRMFITNDSGLMHIAVARQVPTVAIFGPTDHVRTAPYGPAHRVVRKGLECSPCWILKDVGYRQPCLYPTRRCLEGLAVDDVINTVAECLRKNTV
jgi:heptosyltransferase-2